MRAEKMAYGMIVYSIGPHMEADSGNQFKDIKDPQSTVEHPVIIPDQDGRPHVNKLYPHHQKENPEPEEEKKQTSGTLHSRDPTCNYVPRD